MPPIPTKFLTAAGSAAASKTGSSSGFDSLLSKFTGAMSSIDNSLKSYTGKTGPAHYATLAGGAEKMAKGMDIKGDLGEIIGTGAKVGRAVAGDPTAYIELAMDRMKGTYEHGMKAVGHFGDALKHETAGRAAGSYVRGVGEYSEAVLGPAGKPIKWASQLGAAVLESVDKLREWDKSLHDSNMRFADLSASMAAVQAQEQMRNIIMDRDKGEIRSASAKDLAEAKDRLNRTMAPFENAWAILKNKVSAFGTDVADKFINSVMDLTPALKIISEKFGVGEGGGFLDEGAMKIAEGFMNTPAHERYKRPHRFPG